MNGQNQRMQLLNERAAIDIRMGMLRHEVRAKIAELETLARRRADIEVLLATSNGGKPDPGGNAA